MKIIRALPGSKYNLGLRLTHNTFHHLIIYLTKCRTSMYIIFIFISLSVCCGGILTHSSLQSCCRHSYVHGFLKVPPQHFGLIEFWTSTGRRNILTLFFSSLSAVVQTGSRASVRPPRGSCGYSQVAHQPPQV